MTNAMYLDQAKDALARLAGRDSRLQAGEAPELQAIAAALIDIGESLHRIERELTKRGHAERRPAKG